MAIAMLIPYFDVQDLTSIDQLNKSFRAILTPSDPKCLNFEVLCQKRVPSFEIWTKRDLVTENLNWSISSGALMWSHEGG